MHISDLIRVLERDYAVNARASLKNVLYHGKHLARHFGELAVTDITTVLVEEYKAGRLSEGAARATINNELAVLRRAFRLAIRQDLLVRMPHIEALTVANARSGFVEPEQFQLLAARLEARDRAVADIARWLYGLGWRRGEVLGLGWDEADAATGNVHLPEGRTKNRRGKRIALPEDLREVLSRRWDVRRGPYVFQRAGRPIRCFRTLWQSAVTAIGQRGLWVHDLRRSFARNAVIAGVDIKTIMEIGGWRTTSVFLRYLIVDEKLIRSALEKISAYVRGDAPDTPEKILIDALKKIAQ